MTKYLVVIEGEGDTYSAYVPDLPGCVSAGSSRAEVVELMREAIPFHIESMSEHGDPIPEPSAVGAELIEVDDRSVQPA